MLALRSALLLALAILFVFSGVAGAPFHYDDKALFEDPAITRAGGWWLCLRAEQTRPLTWLSFWADYQLWGRNPAPWHIGNLLLHIANALLFWATFQALLPARAAWFAAFFFALHPVQTEAVAYVFARSTLLAAFFCLLSLRLWIAGRHWPAVGVYALALMAKEECAAFPMFLGLLHLSVERPKEERLPVGAMLLLALVAVGRVAYVSAVTKGSGAGLESGVPPGAYFLTQGVALWRYLQLVVAPVGFSFEPDLSATTDWRAYLSWLTLGVAAWLASKRFERAREGFWFLAALALFAPTSSVFPAMDLAADRRVYLPMIALSALAGLLLRRTDYPRLLVLAGIVLGMLSHARVEVWRTEEGLWEDAMRMAPGKARPRIQLARLRPPAEAAALLEEAKKIAPDDAGVASELGRVRLEMGDAGEALKEFGRAVALRPDDAFAYNNRGIALEALGIRERAIEDFQKALELDRCLAPARENLTKLGGTPPENGCDAHP
jgi:tetratricopeptide (TPR) repeat protein